MFEIPDSYPMEPAYQSPIGFCFECGKDIFSGEEIWEIRNQWYCEDCIDGFKTEAQDSEREGYFEEVI
jgi:hypothetical protein